MGSWISWQQILFFSWICYLWLIVAPVFVPPRNSRQRCSVNKGVSIKFKKIHKKTSVSESLFNQVVGLRSATLLKERLWHRCFPVNFAKFLRTSFLRNTSGRLLLIGLHWKYELNVRGSHWRCSVKKDVLRIFANLTGKHLCCSLFLIVTSRLQLY